MAGSAETMAETSTGSPRAGREPRYAVDYPAWRDHGSAPFQLVLEGGAMRNLFTCGVTDFLLDQGILAESVIGASAGSLCGYNYASGAAGRMAYIDIAYRKDWRTMSMRSKLATGNYIGNKFLFFYVPAVAEHFDFSWYADSPVDLISTSSNMFTGLPDYHHFVKSTEEGALYHSMLYLMAGSSLPLANLPVYVDHKLLMDGGVCDCIPYDYGRPRYRGRQLVVLTRPRGFRQHSEYRMKLMSLRYAATPEFAGAVQTKTWRYNRQYSRIEQLHDAGELYAIWPKEPLDVKMAESDPAKLLAAYEAGLERMAELWPDIKRYLGL